MPTRNRKPSFDVRDSKHTSGSLIDAGMVDA